MEKVSPVETKSKLKNSFLLEIPKFCREGVVAIVIVINSVVGGFLWVDLVWLAALTVPLQASYCNQLSDYTFRLQFYRKISEK